MHCSELQLSTHCSILPSVVFSFPSCYRLQLPTQPYTPFRELTPPKEKDSLCPNPDQSHQGLTSLVASCETFFFPSPNPEIPVPVWRHPSPSLRPLAYFAYSGRVGLSGTYREQRRGMQREKCREERPRDRRTPHTTQALSLTTHPANNVGLSHEISPGYPWFRSLGTGPVVYVPTAVRQKLVAWDRLSNIQVDRGYPSTALLWRGSPPKVVWGVPLDQVQGFWAPRPSCRAVGSPSHVVGLSPPHLPESLPGGQVGGSSCCFLRWPCHGHRRSNLRSNLLPRPRQW